MNIIINHNKFTTAVRAVERMVAKNISLPILNTILLKADKNTITLHATNLEIGIRYFIGAKIDANIAIAIPARTLSEFINSIRDEKITISINKNILAIISEKYQTKILCIAPDEFPIIPTLRDATEVQIQTSAIKEAISAVIDSASLLETRPELNGIFVKIEKNKITFAATDSFRLSERSAQITAGVDKEFIIPRNTALEVVRLFSENDTAAILAISENQFAVKTDDFELVSRLVDGRYPDYKKVIPERSIATMTVDKDEFERQIRTASIFSSSISDIQLKISKTGILICAKNSDKGDIAIQQVGELKGDPFDLNLNYRYLLDGLKIIPTKLVRIDFAGVGSPVALRAPEREDLVYIIM